MFENLCELALSHTDRVLLSDGKGDYGIGDVWSASGRVYRYLVEHGVGREDVVMVLLPRGAQALMVVLGVWRAGAAVTIHEDWFSEEWINFAKRDTDCSAGQWRC